MQIVIEDRDIDCVRKKLQHIGFDGADDLIKKFIIRSPHLIFQLYNGTPRLNYFRNSLIQFLDVKDDDGLVMTWPEHFDTIGYEKTFFQKLIDAALEKGFHFSRKSKSLAIR